MEVMNKANSLFVIQAHAKDHIFHCGWQTSIQGLMQGRCPDCKEYSAYFPTLLSSVDGGHLSLEQLEKISIALNAILYGILLKTTKIGDDLHEGCFWAEYVIDPRDGMEGTMWWVGCGGSAYLLASEAVETLAEMAIVFVREVRDHGWESLLDPSERTPIPDVFQYDD